MGQHLWKLLRLKPANGDLSKAYRRVYIETYIRDSNGVVPIFQDWRGRPIKFGIGAFEHAFTRNPGFRQGLNHTAELDQRRAERILWIREVLAVTAGTVSLYQEQFKEDGKPKRRKLFYVVEEAYLVVFNQPTDPNAPLQFVTAYPTSDRDYEREIRRKNGALIDQRKAKKPEGEK